MIKSLMMIGAAAVAVGANASSITIDSVQQRWPWNNKVDITYTVTDGQNRAAGVYWGIDFNVTAGGHTYHVPGYTLGASAEGGSEGRQHTVTWTAPSGIKATDCSMTATLYPTNFPSGNDYMIIQLTGDDAGKVIYEGLLATQGESNSRYNTDEYKTGKLVLRKVPKWADKDELPNAAELTGNGYLTGDANLDNKYYEAGSFPAHSKKVNGLDTYYRNGPTNWNTKCDYYIGVFLVTQKQYVNLGLTNPSYTKGDTKPVDSMSWNIVRDSTPATNAIAPSATGGFLARLNNAVLSKSGISGFDIPTDAMFEIAERAGEPGTYFWGDAADQTTVESKVVCAGNSGGTSTLPVGSMSANNWGLYDVSGNAWEFVRDEVINYFENGSPSIDHRKDAFSPNYFAEGITPSANKRTGAVYNRGGGSYMTEYSGVAFQASYRNILLASDSYRNYSFRVSLVVK